MTAPLQLLCAGAAQGLVKALQVRWRDAGGGEIGGRFGAVGALKEALLAGEACDVMIVTDGWSRRSLLKGGSLLRRARRSAACAPVSR